MVPRMAANQVAFLRLDREDSQSVQCSNWGTMVVTMKKDAGSVTDTPVRVARTQFRKGQPKNAQYWELVKEYQR